VKLIVDTNIVFSTLLNPYSAVGEILMNVQDDLTFFAPELLKEELARYHLKIATYTRLGEKDLADIEQLILSKMTFVPEASINERSWAQAFTLTKDIDEDDTPFIALAIELNAKLWTGDKVLLNGLLKKGADIIITSAGLKKLIK
jgi:predicted nucleic acid-binding protein